jgi:hypothetical protein
VSTNHLEENAAHLHDVAAFEVNATSNQLLVDVSAVRRAEILNGEIPVVVGYSGVA